MAILDVLAKLSAVSVLRSGLRVIAVVGLVWLAIVGLAWAFQERMIYLPSRSSPASLGAGSVFEEVVLDTADGVELAAWFFMHPEPVSTIVVANGNAGNRAHRLLMAEGLRSRGHSVLLFDYRGYGGNPGRPNEEGVVADARAAVDHLRARDDVDAGRIVYLGESLGSAVVAAVAAEQPPAALVLRSPFPSLVEVGRQHYPFLPVRTLLRERHPTAEYLEGYAGPTLVVAGERDRIIPPVLSRKVADSAGASYLEVPDVGHNDRALLDGDMFLDRVDAFVRGAVDN